MSVTVASSLLKQPCPPFGNTIFNFPSGDIYIGSYGMVQPNILIRSGRGMYLCQDRTTYTGEWDDNELIYGKIKYPNGDEYFGNLLNNAYHGRGTYKMPKVGSILGNFWRNSPVGKLTLADVNGHTWTGDQRNNKCIFYPLNHFHQSAIYPGPTNYVPKTSEDNIDVNEEKLISITSRKSLNKKFNK